VKTPSENRSIGMVSMICMVIGNMIGSVIYISTSYALGALGDARLVLIAWAIGGAHAICGAIAYSALARRFSLSGGEYVFMSRFVHPAVGFMAGWISIIAGFTAPIAVSGLVFGEYILGTSQSTFQVRMVATAWILGCAVFHSVNLRTGAWVNNAVVGLKFFCFGIFAVACVIFLSRLGSESTFQPALNQSFFAGDYLRNFGEQEFLNTLLIQLFFIALAYTGFNASIYIAGELPSALVSKSMVLSSILVTATYLLLNSLFLLCDSRESIIAGKDYFVTGVARNVGGRMLEWVMRITIALSSATSVLAMLAIGPRVIAQMSTDGWLPKALSGTETPRLAIGLQALASCLILWNASVLQVISYLGLTLTMCGAIATATLWIAYKEMQAQKPIAWWEHFALAVYILGALLLMLGAWTVKREQFYHCVATFLSGLIVYAVARFWPGKPKSQYKLLWITLLLSLTCSNPSYADETQGTQVRAPTAVKELVDQLSASSYTERKQAFLKLCDPELKIEELLGSDGISDDPQRNAMVMWLKRIRTLDGSIDARIDAICDFSALAQGSIEVVERYTREGKLEMLLQMVRLIPKSSRDMILQNTFTRGKDSVNLLFEGAWAAGQSELLPEFLNVMLPSHPVRIGINRRWNMLDLSDSWKLDVPLDTSEMQIAALESQGQVEQAIQLAKKTNQPGTLEKLILRNHRWDDWLNLDPSRLSLVTAAWSELPRVLILQALDRHDEAQQFYELRKRASGSIGDQQVLLTQMAMVIGDIKTVFDNLKENEPDQLLGMYFLHNRIDELLESEGLVDRNEMTISNWLDRNIVEGKGLSKPTRFQALFRRLGEKQWSDAIQDRIVKFIESHPRDQHVLFWKDYLQQTLRYGLEEKKAELLSLAISKLAGEPQTKRRTGNTVAGFPEAQAEREMTLEDLFKESFPYMKEASYPIFLTMQLDFPEKSPRQLVDWLQQLHQGVLPEGWKIEDVIGLFQRSVTQRIIEGAAPVGSVIDLAEALETLDATKEAIELLDSVRGDVRADLMRSQFLWKLGKYQQARSLALSCLDRNSGSLEAYQWTSDLLQRMNDTTSLKLLEHKVLTRPNGMEDFARYSQEMRRGERFELPEPIGRFLEIQHDSFPSSLGNLWLEDIYWGWNLSLLANHYHQTAPDFPKRVSKNFELALTSCLNDIFTEFDSLSGMNLRVARSRGSIGWELDWSQWAWRYERVLAGAFWQAVRDGDRPRADRFLRAAHRINPEQINTLIDAVPWILERFDRETLKQWYLVYYEPMKEHLKKYPQDTLIANNCAWLSIKCGFELEQALELSEMVTKLNPSDTYLDTLAEVHFVRGDLEKAIEISLECGRLNPRDPHHHRQLKRYSNSKKPIP